MLCNSDGSNQNFVTCTGFDATYEIFREKFNLVAYGRTDLKRAYHPIAFMVTSHECTEDYEYFYRSLSHNTSSLSIPLSICYVVQDASLSEYQGLKNVFPEACVLMCYFHVTSNVIKNYCKYNVQLVKRKQINTEIYYYKIEVSGFYKSNKIL